MTWKTLSKLFLCLIVFPSLLVSCKDQSQNKADEETVTQNTEKQDSLFFKLSLAQWSFHKPIFDGEMDPMDFAKEASDLGFDGIEYVNSFYAERIKNAEDPKAEMQLVLDTLKAKSEEFGVRNVLIMVDGEGDLAVTDSVKRNEAVDNHKKWIDAAQFLGCHSIRVNLFGSEDAEEWKNASADALSKLSEYAATKGVNVLVENHGGFSSDADLLVSVMEQVNMENCGTLPDFGNFCLKREGGARWQAKCVEEYPIYEGVEKLMAYAKAVSAKSYEFDDNGSETKIDYNKMVNIVEKAGYNGFIGVEFEGSAPPMEGIKATRDLLIESAKSE